MSSLSCGGTPVTLSVKPAASSQLQGICQPSLRLTSARALRRWQRHPQSKAATTVIAIAALAGARRGLRWRRRGQLHVNGVYRVLARAKGDGWLEESDPEIGLLSKRAPLLIDGQIEVTEETFSVYAPATGELVGVAPVATYGQVIAAVEAADRAKQYWGALPHDVRKNALASCAAALREHAEALATLQTNESGRPIKETRIEVQVAAACFDKAGQSLDSTVERDIEGDDEKRVVVRHCPLGVVTVIAPWNAPIVLGWKPTAAALACGNTVVLKPAPQTPLTTLRIGELLRCLLPPGVLNVVVAPDTQVPKVGEVLTSHPLVRKVVFTGSTLVGRKVMEACARDFKRLLLELGGNDAAIVREDVDITATADGVFKAAFFNNGQTCVAIKRLYVHENIFDSFCQALAARARRATIGNGLIEGVELGPLASDAQLQQVEALLKDARRFGGKILCGGGAVAGPPGDEGKGTGLFYLPTIVVGVQEGVRLVDEEQFGPVLPVMPYKTDAEAVKRANATPYGLGASVWSKDLEMASQLGDQLEAGTVWINRHCEFIRNAPFGGFGNSGFGRGGDLGPYDLREFTEAKTVVLPRVKPRLGAAGPIALETHIDSKGQQMLHRSLTRIGSNLLEIDAFEKEAEEALSTFPFQPVDFRSVLNSLSLATGPSCVVVRGLPQSAGDELLYSSILLGSIALIGGRAFTYANFCEEALVRDLQDEGATIFGWHRSGRCSPPYCAPRRFYRPDEYVPEFVAVLCAEAQSPVSGRFVDFRELVSLISDEDRELLKHQPLAFFDKEKGQRSEPVAIVHSLEASAPAPVVELRDPIRYEPEGDPATVEAYSRVLRLADEICRTFVLEPGSMVIFNNRRCVHCWQHESTELDVPPKLHAVGALRTAGEGLLPRVVQ
mmetsp:Transcript_59055/g.132249  ORF Transcript_59055/g.132249 Transcript_59055/m.132249 type:complete len:898 (-) Transcript_59055:14-2707(-)